MIEKPGAVNWIKCAIGVAVILYFFSYYKDPSAHYVIETINLIFHEAGHTLFSWAPWVIHVAAGSFFQILFPLIFVGYFALRQQFYSASVLGFWVATNFFGVARYVADADVMKLELLSGDKNNHDWNNLLGHFGLLDRAVELGNVFIAFGLFVAFISAVGVLYFSFEHKPKTLDVGRF